MICANLGWITRWSEMLLSFNAKVTQRPILCIKSIEKTEGHEPPRAQSPQYQSLDPFFPCEQCRFLK